MNSTEYDVTEFRAELLDGQRKSYETFSATVDGFRTVQNSVREAIDQDRRDHRVREATASRTELLAFGGMILVGIVVILGPLFVREHGLVIPFNDQLFSIGSDLIAAGFGAYLIARILTRNQTRLLVEAEAARTRTLANMKIDRMIEDLALFNALLDELNTNDDLAGYQATLVAAHELSLDVIETYLDSLAHQIVAYTELQGHQGIDDLRKTLQQAFEQASRLRQGIIKARQTDSHILRLISELPVSLRVAHRTKTDTLPSTGSS